MMFTTLFVTLAPPMTAKVVVRAKGPFLWTGVALPTSTEL